MKKSDVSSGMVLQSIKYPNLKIKILDKDRATGKEYVLAEVLSTDQNTKNQCTVGELAEFSIYYYEPVPSTYQQEILCSGSFMADTNRTELLETARKVGNDIDAHVNNLRDKKDMGFFGKIMFDVELPVGFKAVDAAKFIRWVKIAYPMYNSLEDALQSRTLTYLLNKWEVFKKEGSKPFVDQDEETETPEEDEYDWSLSAQIANLTKQNAELVQELAKWNEQTAKVESLNSDQAAIIENLRKELKDFQGGQDKHYCNNAVWLLRWILAGNLEEYPTEVPTMQEVHRFLMWTAKQGLDLEGSSIKTIKHIRDWRNS